jgi:hypothetical protein
MMFLAKLFLTTNSFNDLLDAYEFKGTNFTVSGFWDARLGDFCRRIFGEPDAKTDAESFLVEVFADFDSADSSDVNFTGTNDKPLVFSSAEQGSKSFEYK